MRNLVMALLLLTSAAWAGPEQVLTGTFVELQFGDYAHLQVRTDKGEERSFWLSNDPSLVKVVENAESYRGKRIKVHWHKVTKDIPQAGGAMELEEATRVELLE